MRNRRLLAIAMIALTNAASLSPFKIAHEGLVDLERRQRKALEIAQGRVAGTEVIDGQIYPELGDCGHRVECSFLHHRAFGELQPQIPGATPWAPSRSRTVRGNAGSVS